MRRTTTAIVWLTSLSVIAITLAFLWWAQSGRFEGASNSRQLAGVHPIRAWQAALEQMGSTGHQNAALGFTGSGRTTPFTYFNLPLRSIAVFLLWIAAVLGVGYMACRRCLHELSPAEQGLLTFAIGFVALGLLVLGIGLVGLARPIPLWTTVILAALACVPFGKEARAAAADMLPRLRVIVRPGAPDDTASPEARLSAGSVLLAVCILVVFFAVGLFALTPPIQSDAMRYHLAAPQEYLKLGKIGYLPHNAFSNFPFLLEMHFLIALGLGAPEASQLMHMALLVASALGAWCFWRRFFSKQTGNAGLLWCLAAYSGIPVSLLVSTWPSNDQAVAFFLFMSVYTALLAANLNRTSYYAVAGIMAGGALGTKYTALPFIAILGVLWAADLLITQDPGAAICTDTSDAAAGDESSENLAGKQPGVSGSRKAIGLRLGVALVMLLLSGGPWFMKNMVLTGNPVYPAANELFHGGDWSIENAIGLSAKMHEKGTSTTPLNLLLSLIRINTEWTPRYEDHFLGIVFPAILLAGLTGLAIGLMSRRSRRAAAYLAFMALAYYVSWFYSYQSNRMLLPLALLLPGTLECFRLALERRRSLGLAVAVVAFVACAHGWVWAIEWIYSGSRLSVPAFLSGGISRQQFLARNLSYYTAFDYLNSRVKPTERVLLIGEHRVHYAQFRAIWSDWYDTPAIAALIRQHRVKDFDGLVRVMNQQQIRWVLFNGPELAPQMERYFRPRFSAEEWNLLQQLLEWPRMRARTFSPGVTVFELPAPA